MSGDVDYGVIGAGYATFRRTDARIEALVHAALGDARTVLNVGAGAGSYEPDDRHVVAVEPSAAMRAQRPSHRVPAVRAVAADLPFDDGSFDAAMALVTVHQWPDLRAGLDEVRRVTRGPLVVLTFDPEALDAFWLAHYAPDLIEAERGRYPTMPALADALGGTVTASVVPIPRDCTDGFTEAYYARPERMLDPDGRRAQSAWAFVTPESQQRSADALAADLASGEWDRRWGALRERETYEGSLRLVVATDRAPGP
jgi:ubiquinone/menaquinone biosynthesis C-methylase UbiE